MRLVVPDVPVEVTFSRPEDALALFKRRSVSITSRRDRHWQRFRRNGGNLAAVLPPN